MATVIDGDRGAWVEHFIDVRGIVVIIIVVAVVVVVVVIVVRDNRTPTLRGTTRRTRGRGTLLCEFRGGGQRPLGFERTSVLVERGVAPAERVTLTSRGVFLGAG